MSFINKLTYILKQPHYLFIILAGVFGMFFVIEIPPLWGLDESAHFGHVYQIVHNEGSLKLPENLINLSTYSHNDIADVANLPYGRRDKEVDNPRMYKGLLSEKFSKNQAPAYGVATYSPVAYIGPIIGGSIAAVSNLNIGQTLLLERILSLLMYVGIVGWAIYLVRKYKIKWFILLAALLPSALFNGSMVTADTMLIPSGLLLLALFIRFLTTDNVAKSKKILYLLGLFALLLPLIKFNYVLLSLGLVAALPLKRVYSRHSGLIKVVAAFMISLVSVLWVFVSGGISTSQAQLPGGASASVGQLDFMMHHPTGFLTAILRSAQSGGDFYVTSGSTLVGWNYVSVPLAVSTLMLVVIFIVLIIGMKELTAQRKYFILPAVFSIAGIVSVFLTLYLAATPTALFVVQGVQGRYLVPFIVPVASLAAAYSAVEVKRKSEKYMIRGSIVLLTIILFWTIFIYYSYTY